jgi:hypothetical protein
MDHDLDSTPDAEHRFNHQPGANPGISNAAPPDADTQQSLRQREVLEKIAEARRIILETGERNTPTRRTP